MKPPFTGGTVECGAEKFTAAVARGRGLQETAAWRSTSHDTPHDADIPLSGSTAAPEQHCGSKRHRRGSYAQQQTPKSTGCERRQQSGSHQQPHKWTLEQRHNGEQQRHHEQIGRQGLFQSCVQQRQRQGWFPDERRRKEPNEGQQRSMVHSSLFQERETQQERWLHNGGGSRGEQQDRRPLLGERGRKCLPEVRHRLYGQQLLQRNSEESVRKQQHRQCHKGRNFQQQCCPLALASARCSAGATAPPSMLHAGAAALDEGRPSSEVEVQQKLSHRRGDTSSSTRRGMTRTDAETCSSNSNRERSSGELRISGFGENSSSSYGASIEEARASDNEKEYNGSCTYKKRNSNRWETGIVCNEEDGIVMQARSSSRPQRTDADETRGATSIEEGSSECRLRKRSAPWIDYDFAREGSAAADLTSSSSNLLGLERTPVEPAARRASEAPTAASGSLTSSRALAVVKKTRKRIIGEHERAERRWEAGERAWPIEDAEVEGAVAAKRNATAAPHRTPAAADLVAAACSRDVSAGKRRSSTGEDVLDRFAAAGAAVVYEETRGQNTLTTAADAGSTVSGTSPTATAEQSCNCGWCSYCCRVVDDGDEATDAKGFETGTPAASSDRRTEGERKTQSQDAARAGPAASGGAASGGAASGEAPQGEARKPATVATEEGELRGHLRRVEALNEVLLTNISSLYKTAKAELDRKDAAIAEKDRQIADLRLKLQEFTGGVPRQQQRGVSFCKSYGTTTSSRLATAAAAAAKENARAAAHSLRAPPFS